LAQGDVKTAAATIRRALDEASGSRSRARLLAAHTEIMLADGDPAAARRAADELADIERSYDTPFTRAVAAVASGTVLLAEGDGRASLAALRRAWAVWHEIDAPYEAARARVQIARACLALGDSDSAGLELAEARRTFELLGAAPDIARLDALTVQVPPGAHPRLTPREGQVLRLLATGRTNRAIAADLLISEKTVARHVSNIFMKLGVTTRSAATAYAWQRDLM
jgi:ATP/maltotriose-dependent transcriptional regulator MalT